MCGHKHTPLADENLTFWTSGSLAGHLAVAFWTSGLLAVDLAYNIGIGVATILDSLISAYQVPYSLKKITLF